MTPFVRTLVMAVCAAAVGLYIYIVEQPKIASEEAAGFLARFKTDDAVLLQLEYAGNRILRVVRSANAEGAVGGPADAWEMEKPLITKADPEPIKLLLDKILETEVERRIPLDDAQDLETYGLRGEELHAKVTVGLADGTVMPTILVGKTTPVGYQAFAQVEGRDEVLVVPLLFHSGVAKDPFDLRDKTLFERRVDDATTVELKNAAGSFRMEKTDAGWQLTEPSKGKADFLTIRTLLDSVPSITALDYFDVKAPKGDTGLAEPAIRIVVETPGGKTGFKVGVEAEGTPKGFYLERLDGLVAKAPEWVVNRYSVDLEALRDKRLFDCAPEAVGRAVFERADGRGFSLVRDGDDWRFEAGATGDVDQRAAERTLTKLAEIAGKSVLSDSADSPERLASFDLDEPDVEVSLEDRSGGPCGTAIAAKAAGGARYTVARKNSPVVMSLPEYLYSRFDLLASDLGGE